MTTIDRRVVSAATGQLGIITRARAHRAGVSDAQLRSRVSSGFLRQTGPHTFQLAGAPSSPRSQLAALVADLQGEVFASGPTAAALHGFDGFRLRPPFDVTILRNRNLRRIGHRVHTTIRLDLIDRSCVDSMPVTSAARTMIDLARTESVERLRIAYDSGLRDGLFNESLVHRRLVALRAKGRHGIPKLLAAIEGLEIVSGAHSWLERYFLKLVEAAGLRRPDTQVVLTSASDRLVRVDFRFLGTPIVVEVLGYRYHRTPEQLRRDTARLNALVADGFAPYQFTYQQLVEEPESVVDQLRRVLPPIFCVTEHHRPGHLRSHRTESARTPALCVTEHHRPRHLRSHRTEMSDGGGTGSANTAGRRVAFRRWTRGTSAGATTTPCCSIWTV